MTTNEQSGERPEPADDQRTALRAAAEAYKAARDDHDHTTPPKVPAALLAEVDTILALLDERDQLNDEAEDASDEIDRLHAERERPEPATDELLDRLDALYAAIADAMPGGRRAEKRHMFTAAIEDAWPAIIARVREAEADAGQARSDLGDVNGLAYDLHERKKLVTAAHDHWQHLAGVYRSERDDAREQLRTAREALAAGDRKCELAYDALATVFDNDEVLNAARDHGAYILFKAGLSYVADARAALAGTTGDDAAVPTMDGAAASDHELDEALRLSAAGEPVPPNLIARLVRRVRSEEGRRANEWWRDHAKGDDAAGGWLPAGTIPEPGAYYHWIEGRMERVKDEPFIRRVGRPSAIGKNIRIHSRRLPDPPAPPEDASEAGDAKGGERDD